MKISLENYDFKEKNEGFMHQIFILLLLFFTSFQNLTAQPAISLEQYAAIVGTINPITHRISTLNRNGAAMCYTTELTDAFLEHCRDCFYVLEVGCAYGIKASQIVQTGVFLTANDLDPRHLDVMKKAFMQLAENYPCFNNVRYVSGNFANMNEEQIGSQKYDAILCESVMHFMTPSEFRNTLKNFYSFLNNKGKVYITVFTPYHPEYYEVFQINKANGIEWPGIFTDPAGISPIIYNIVDEEILTRELLNAGFNVLKSKYIQKPFLEKKSQYDGRDWLIVIAQKE